MKVAQVVVVPSMDEVPLASPLTWAYSCSCS